MRKTNRVIYFVEGECEAKLINALKEVPAAIRPGKVKIINVIQNLISASQLVQIQAGTTVVLVFDTDVPKTDCLKENIIQLRKKCTRVEVVFLPQVRNFEEELVRCADVERVSELTHSRSSRDFKRDFCAATNARNLLERHHLDSGMPWQDSLSGDRRGWPGPDTAGAGGGCAAWFLHPIQNRFFCDYRSASVPPEILRPSPMSIQRFVCLPGREGYGF